MNYVINVTIFKTVDLNLSKKDKDGKDLEPKLDKVMSSRQSFNILVPGKDATNTVAELKTKVKAEMQLPDTITDVKMTAKGKDLADADVVTSYSPSYEATLPYVAPLKK